LSPVSCRLFDAADLSCSRRKSSMMAPASDLTDGHTCTALLQGAEQGTISLLLAEGDLGTVAARSKPGGSASASGPTATMTKATI
jgi:hypothetical protein